MTQRTMPVRFLRAAASTAEHRGVALHEWLDRVDIDAALLFDDKGRITVEQASRVVRDLWRMTDDELLGLGAEPVPRGSWRLVCLAVINVPDLRTVIDRFVEFSTVLPGFPALAVETGKATTRLSIEIDESDDPAHLMADLALSIGIRFFSWLVGQRLPVARVELPYALPEGAEDYDLVFGRRVVFDQAKAAVILDNQFLTLPVVRDEAELDEWLCNAPADLLMYRDYGSSASDQVRRILERGLRGTWPTPDEVAAQLAMSTQNLRRLLREEGTSMSQIKEELMRDAAVASLVRGDEPVAALSDRLGFSEPSAFHRAFRRWTGSPPGAYRRGEPDPC